MKKAMNCILCFLLFTILLGGGVTQAYAVDVTVKIPSIIPVGADNITINMGSVGQGYVEICKNEDNSNRYKLLLIKDGGTRYCYNIPYTDGSNALRYSFSEGSGNYSIIICRHKTDTTYSVVFSTRIEVHYEDVVAPFLTPNMYVDYAEYGPIAAFTEKLTADCKSDDEKTEVIYDWITDNISYDYDFAAIATSDYYPNAEDTLLDRDGICSDFSALMVSMLRISGIPAKVIVGYVGKTQCHAWIEVYCSKTNEWERMDPTFAACGKKADNILKYIKDDSNYQSKYQY